MADPLPFGQRVRRGLDWPIIFWTLWRGGLSARDAWRGTHLWVWGLL